MGEVPQITRYGHYSSEHDCRSRLDFRPTTPKILPSELLNVDRGLPSIKGTPAQLVYFVENPLDKRMMRVPLSPA